MYYFDLYLEFVKIKLKIMMEYRGYTLIFGIAQICSYFAEFAVMWIAISKFERIGNWNAYEVMLIYALNIFGYALANVFIFSPCQMLAELIRTGELDGVITKPTNPFLYLCFSNFNTGYWAHITLALGLIFFALQKLGIPLTAFKVIFLIITGISSALIQGSMKLIVTVPAFWLVKAGALHHVHWLAYDFIKYPVSIYHVSVQFVLTCIVPYAFVSFYPLQYLLGKNDFLMFHPAIQFLAPVIGILMAVLAYCFWLLGLKSYNSSGS